MNTTIKLAAVALLLAGTAAMAANKTVTRNSHNHSHNTTTNNYTTVGSQGAAGVNGSDGKDSTIDLSKLRVSSSAMDSVELNPDHSGFSVGLGASGNGGYYAGAVGVMYGIKIEGDKPVKNIGVNVKAYNGEGGYAGASVGITLGF